jgi:hypothetical protein
MRKLFTPTAMAATLALLSCGVMAQTAVQKPAAHATAAHHAAPHTTKTLSDEQLVIAEMVTTGRISCADGHSVTITPDAKIKGAFDLKFGSSKYDVEPMPTKSGAIRLEDRKTGIVFMQLANKSMLFNERAGKRLADDCINASQQAVADQMKSQPGMFDSLSR